MKGHPFYVADVFAERKYAGNQLAIIRHAADISSEEMLHITREMNYSETTFILSDTPENGGYHVRIFTPGGEVPFAGHPTLGTAALIREIITPDKPDRIILNLKIGQIPVDVIDNIYWMKQINPEFGKCYSPDEISSVIGLSPSALTPDLPVQWVSTGLPTVIVPLKDLDSVKKVKINREAYTTFINRNGPVLILIFTPKTLFPENHIHDRVLAPCYGVEEDPATGSANGCLAGYLVKNRVMGSATIENIRVEQGYQVNRPSLLLLTAQDHGKEVEIRVGGKVLFTAQGNLL